MAKMTKNVIMGSMGVAGVVALVALIDIVAGVPFGGQMVMDIMFIVGAAMVGYMGWDSYRDLR